MYLPYVCTLPYEAMSTPAQMVGGESHPLSSDSRGFAEHGPMKESSYQIHNSLEALGDGHLSRFTRPGKEAVGNLWEPMGTYRTLCIV